MEKRKGGNGANEGRVAVGRYLVGDEGRARKGGRASKHASRVSNRVKFGSREGRVQGGKGDGCGGKKGKSKKRGIEEGSGLAVFGR